MADGRWPMLVYRSSAIRIRAAVAGATHRLPHASDFPAVEQPEKPRRPHPPFAHVAVALVHAPPARQLIAERIWPVPLVRGIRVRAPPRRTAPVLRPRGIDDVFAPPFDPMSQRNAGALEPGGPATLPRQEGGPAPRALVPLLRALDQVVSHRTTDRWDRDVVVLASRIPRAPRRTADTRMLTPPRIPGGEQGLFAARRTRPSQRSASVTPP